MCPSKSIESGKVWRWLEPMTKDQLEGSPKFFRNHLDPKKDEQLKWIKTEIDKKVGKILSLAKSFNKDGSSKKQSELIHLIEDVHHQYESLYLRCEDLRVDVKNNFKGGDSNSPSSTSASDTESYYSLDELSVGRNGESPNAPSEDNLNIETSSDAEYTILKDKLTSSSEVKGMTATRSQSPAVTEELEEQTVQDKESRTARQSLGQVEELNGEVAKLKAENEMLCFQKQQLEEQMEHKQNEAEQIEDKVLQQEARILELEEAFKESESLQDEENSYLSRISKLQLQVNELQASLSERENELSAQQAQIKSLNEKVQEQENKLEEMNNDRNSLQVELDTLRNEKQDYTLKELQMEKINSDLTDKLANQQKTMLELGEAINKLKAENEKVLSSKINTHAVERKVEEMAEEMRNEFEAKCTILSRRIKVAEQMQIENKEWCLQTKEVYEEKSKELKEWTDRNETGLKSIQDVSVAANDILFSLDRVALRFEDRTANFLNRISKASCELKFTQDWATRKNNTLSYLKNEVDNLLSQLDEKEAEILIFREKMWKSENKVRELEKLIKKKEDGMVGLEEEKREAIRQLCVWIDYHRSRSDYYKKMVSEVYPGGGRRKVS